MGASLDKSKASWLEKPGQTQMKFEFIKSKNIVFCLDSKLGIIAPVKAGIYLTS